MNLFHAVKKRQPLISLGFLGGFFLFLLLAGVAIASGGEHGGEGQGGWAITDTYRVINFAVLAIALFFVLRKPVAQFLGDRIKGIEEELTTLESKKKAAEKKLAEYNERLAALEAEAGKILDQYRLQGENARARILEEAKVAAAKLTEQAKENIKREFAEVKLQLETEVFEKALVAAAAKLKQGINKDDQKRLVDEYLEKVVIK
ncbi:MAG: ATP synthase F0 subunit B [Deltaproteobacteria bacterium]|nr:ATP synthase F0 subunit B [Deltaproteobacteria bacterium]